MITYTYVHDCPKDTGDKGCPVNGETVVQRPTMLGSYYLMVPIRCAYTDVELRLVGITR